MRIVFTDEYMYILSKYGERHFALKDYPRLLNATDVQRYNYRIIGDEEGVHWKDLDEDIKISLDS